TCDVGEAVAVRVRGGRLAARAPRAVGGLPVVTDLRAAASASAVLDHARKPYAATARASTQAHACARCGRPLAAPRVTPAVVAARRAKIWHELREYRHDADAPSYGVEAAQALGLDPEHVFKTLVAECDGTLVVALVPVARSLDLKALAAAVGAKR